MALTKVTGQVILPTTDLTVGVLTVTNSVSIGGTLTYEDVTNVDSVGLITARDGINVIGAGVTIRAGGLNVTSGVSTFSANVKVGTGITLSPDGDVYATGVTTSTIFKGTTGTFTGTVTANAFSGDGAGLSNVGVDTGVVFTDKLSLGDSEYINVGLSSDLQIYHDSSHSYISESGTGSLKIKGDDIRLESANGTNLIQTNGTNAIELKYGGNTKFATASNGVSVTGKVAATGDIDSGTGYYQINSGTTRFSLTHDGANCYLANEIGSFYVKTVDNTNTLEISNDTVAIPNDNDKLKIGAGGDLEIFHDGSNTRIYNNTGSLFFRASDFYFQDTTGDENIAKFIDNGACELYHDNVKKFETASTGVVVTGGTSARPLKVNSLHTSGGEIAVFDNGVNNHYGALLISAGITDREARIESAYGNSFLTFYTQAGSASEKMRITSDGRVRFSMNNFGASPSSSNYGIEIANTNMASVWSATGTSTANHIIWVNANGTCGSIQTSGSNTSYNTSSDYRLKENNVAISDGIARVKNLKPYRFNWIADSTNTPQDGFFAHEVQSVVPEASSGTKDQVELEDNAERDIKKGDIIPQGIDQSKLVPLLTAALKEAITKIETLETKVAALESA